MTRFCIRARRKARGISQAELARRLGVAAMSVSQWEQGEAMPTADKLPTIAAVLECEIRELYDDELLRAASEAARAAVAKKASADAQKLAEQAG